MCRSRSLPIALIALLPAVAPSSAAAGDTEECIAAYEQAQRLRKRSMLARSRDELRSCIAPRCPDALRKDCGVWLDELEAAIPTVVLQVRDAHGHAVPYQARLDSLEITQLAGAPVELDPGPHAIVVESPGRRTQRFVFVAHAGEKNRTLRLTFERELPAAFYLLAGVGVAELGTGAYFGWRSHDQADDCGSRCTEGDREAIRTSRLASGISAGIGALALGGAAWVYLSQPPARWEETSSFRRPEARFRVACSSVASAPVVAVTGEF